MREKLAAFALFAILLFVCVIGKIGAGTFVIDFFMLTFLSYWVTRWLYRPGGFIAAPPGSRGFRSFLRFFFAAFAPILSIVPLWVGGALAYWDFVPATDVYFGAIPASVLGTDNGNDFMWRIIVPGLGSWQTVPAQLLPTYQHGIIPGLGISVFTLWGIAVWLGMPVVFGWAALKGMAHSFLYAEWSSGQRFKETFKMFVIGLILNFGVITVTKFLVFVYS